MVCSGSVVRCMANVPRRHGATNITHETALSELESGESGRRVPYAELLRPFSPSHRTWLSVPLPTLVHTATVESRTANLGDSQTVTLEVLGRVDVLDIHNGLCRICSLMDTPVSSDDRDEAYGTLGYTRMVVVPKD